VKPSGGTAPDEEFFERSGVNLVAGRARLRKSDLLRAVCDAGNELLDKRKANPEGGAAVIAIFRPYQPSVSLDNGASDG
jgi:hypothetical protein